MEDETIIVLSTAAKTKQSKFGLHLDQTPTYWKHNIIKKNQITFCGNVIVIRERVILSVVILCHGFRRRKKIDTMG